MIVKKKTASKVPPASKALTVTDRARAVMRFDEQKRQLVKLAADSVRIVEIKDSAGAKECHAARMRLKDARVAIKNTGKAARDDAVKFSKAVITSEGELIKIIEPEEERLEVIEDAWEAERAKEREAKLEAERERIAQIERDRLAEQEAELQRQRDEIRRERDELAQKQRDADTRFENARRDEQAAAALLAKAAAPPASEVIAAREQERTETKQAADAERQTAEAAAIERATLTDAAEAALALLRELKQEEHLAYRMLFAAWSKWKTASTKPKKRNQHGK